MLAEVYLNKDKVEELGLTDINTSLKKDIADVCMPLPVYKKIAQIKIRETEFPKTTTNKIKR